MKTINAVQVQTTSILELSTEINKKASEIALFTKSEVTEETLPTATGFIDDYKRIKKQVDEQIESACRPIIDHEKECAKVKKEIRTEGEALLKSLSESVELLKTNMLAYNKKREERQNRLNMFARVGVIYEDGDVLDLSQEEFDKMYKFALSRLAFSGVNATAPVVAVPVADKVKGMRKDWVFEIVNPQLIPREYLLPATSLIQTAIESGGVREIPGLKIYQKESIR